MAIPALDPQCACDEIPQSQYGPVEDQEVLVRFLTDKHYKGTRLLNSAFKVRDIQADGVSLVRIGMMTAGELQDAAEAVRRLMKASAVAGALSLSAEQLRGLRHADGSRKLCVFDDPVIEDEMLPDNPAHCMAVSPTGIDEADALEIRDHLLGIFSEARDLDELWHRVNSAGA
ncbi:MAG: hypothetical protein EOO38_22420 [Cytophagaceae bacterium]|nr:MAG: hypothetical protein EOO38_22420 [Cytophagaceae bacterium]